IVFVVMMSVAVAMERLWLNALQPQIATRFAIKQLNGNDNAFRELRLFEAYKSMADGAILVFALIIAWYLATRPGWPGRGRGSQLLVVIATLFGVTGCIRSYDRPEYTEIDTSETGFLIPLEGDSGIQSKF